MKAVVLTCFESNEERAGFVVDTFKELNFEVIGVTSDFSHIRKTFRKSFPKDFLSIKTMAYKKNMSIQRMVSHRIFARDAYKKIEEIKPDIIWVCEPANSLLLETNRYKKKYPHVKVIVDVIDMWPESFPINRFKNTFPFKLWKSFRTNNINCADQLVTECNLYQDILKNEYNGKEINTIYWARETRTKEYKLNLPKDKLALVYIGSINNIIDADLIGKIIDNLDNVTLHIIGDGENKNNFINTLKDKCELQYHGPVYDAQEKEYIFSKCHAGLNIYKEGLYIGLTVKSIDYFNYGLPIINNIKGDTYNFVKDNNAGINVEGDYTINQESLIEYRNNNKHILEMFNQNFTKEVFIDKCKKVIEKVL